jgi:hypothetical protein
MSVCVRRPSFFEDARAMCFHRALADEQPVANHGVRPAFRHRVKHLTLAIGERLVRIHGGGAVDEAAHERIRHVGGDMVPASRHGRHRLGQLLRRTRFQQVTPGAALQRAHHEVVAALAESTSTRTCLTRAS